jgi:hypothetical protein
MSAGGRGAKQAEKGLVQARCLVPKPQKRLLSAIVARPGDQNVLNVRYGIFFSFLPSRVAIYFFSFTLSGKQPLAAAVAARGF